MHVIYVDESGTPDLESSSDHFVVAGIAIPLSTWKGKDRELRAILNQHRLSHTEIHTAWMARYYPEQERIKNFGNYNDSERRQLLENERKIDIAKAALKGEDLVKGLIKNYKKTKNYIHLTYSERIAVLEHIADTVGRWNDARLFGDAHQKKYLTQSQRDRSREFALEQITTRYNAYLENIFGTNALGIMVHDQNQAESLSLTTLFRRWLTTGTTFSNISHIAETPLFVDSSLTMMVQVADLVAYATRRFCDKGETNLFDRIYDRFDRDSRKKKLVGLRHYTGKIKCQCRICLDHAR